MQITFVAHLRKNPKVFVVHFPNIAIHFLYNSFTILLVISLVVVIHVFNK